MKKKNLLLTVFSLLTIGTYANIKPASISLKTRPMLWASRLLSPDSRSTEMGVGLISLDGEWMFQLDFSSKGASEKWYTQDLNDYIKLPGTTDEAHKGTLTTNREAGRFTRVYQFYGPAWYQRIVDIPKNWSQKNILLVLERTKLTTVYVDDLPAGTNNTLAGKQRYDLSHLLKPGKHRLTIVVNNRERPPIGDPHQISDNTQTNWNGILGKIQLVARDQVWMKDVQLFPDLAKKTVRVKIKFGRMKGMKVKGNVTIRANTWNIAKPQNVSPVTVPCEADSSGYFELIYPLGKHPKLWSEFSPALYRFHISYEGFYQGARFFDEQEINTGLRDFKAKSTQFSINNKITFIRGKHDACVFPLTGYAPMTVDGWLKIFRIAKSYGINLYRFHTWCPPEAAFEAADMIGMYLQPELPIWGSIGRPTEVRVGDVEQHIDNDPVAQRTAYLMAEGGRILQDYGNYASFVMFALGNELTGSKQVMADMVKNFRTYDNRHLYAQGSNNFLNAPELAAGDDYWATTMTGGHYTAGNYRIDTRGKDVRSSYPVDTVGHINNLFVGTTYDYQRSIEGISMPVIGHEIGQYQTYPNFKEIKKYTGVLQARNFEIYKERLETTGMGDQADDFFKASGALAVLCYKEEIETAMRTKGFGGFHLLDLQDFPGQGTALVGILDAFMDSKGLIKPEEWRQFCNSVVPLVKMKSFTWNSSEHFIAQAEVANYGAGDLSASPIWTVKDDQGKVIKSGNMSHVKALQGTLTALGTIRLDLNWVSTPQKLVLALQFGKYTNTYPFWVYPVFREKPDTSGILITTKLDSQVMTQLKSGSKVLLMPSKNELKQSIRGNFQADFWSFAMFKKYNPPGTLGILCDPAKPALTGFPTEFHSNWQWWRLLRNSPVMILDNLSAKLKPIVQVIDNLDRNHKLGVIFEASIGKGMLLVSSIPLHQLQQYSEGQTLYRSLLKYMHTSLFKPAVSLEDEALSGLFTQ